MSVKYLVVFKNGDRLLVDRHFKLGDYIYGLSITKRTFIEQIEGVPETIAFSCPEINVEYIEELPVSHQMIATFNEIYESMDVSEDDMSADELASLQRDINEIEKIYG